MTTPIPLSKDYVTSRSELRAAFAGTLEKRRPPLGFILGLLSTIAIACAVAYVLFYR